MTLRVSILYFLATVIITVVIMFLLLLLASCATPRQQESLYDHEARHVSGFIHPIGENGKSIPWKWGKNQSAILCTNIEWVQESWDVISQKCGEKACVIGCRVYSGYSEVEAHSQMVALYPIN